MSAPLLAFKAGRAFRRENTNFVDANPTKGAILLYNDDDLVHLKWKNRTTGVEEDDLILFPQDASFTKVSQSAWGRTYVLKFASSNQKHFFWMQDASSARDDEFVNNLNALIEDPYTPLEWSTPSESSTQPQASTSSAHSSVPAALGTGPQPTQEQLDQLRSLIARVSSETAAPAHPAVSLRDILSPENVAPLFTNHPELIPALFPHLPPDLPVPPSAEVLQQVIASPQFQSAVRNLDQALHTGLLGGLVQSLGLPEEAGTGVEPFLRAVQEQADQSKGGERDAEHEDQMDTD